LFVYDRYNYRIQILSLTGEFVSQISHQGFCYGISVGSNFIYTWHYNDIKVWN
jgi:hypothetical protein